ncbi:MAG: c-type cytochrome [Planctomycetota bacterium]|nr:c-type cytochrome [Planctomycetota bacterium]
MNMSTWRIHTAIWILGLAGILGERLTVAQPPPVKLAGEASGTLAVTNGVSRESADEGDVAPVSSEEIDAGDQIPLLEETLNKSQRVLSGWSAWPVEGKPTDPAILKAVQTGETDTEKSRVFVASGAKWYQRHCSICHGKQGQGDGELAEVMWPRPRDFTGKNTESGRPFFKFRTAQGQGGELLPDADDLFRTISRGLSGTLMSGWGDQLSPETRWQLIAYIKQFAPDAWHGEYHYNPAMTSTDQAGKVVNGLERPMPVLSQNQLKQGRMVYEWARCWSCHGWLMRGDGQALGTHKDQWGYPVWPQNLTRAMNYKTGHQPRDIFRTITMGVAGSVMPQHDQALVSVLRLDLELIADPEADPVEQIETIEMVQEVLSEEPKRLLNRLETHTLSVTDRVGLIDRLKQLDDGSAVEAADWRQLAETHENEGNSELTKRVLEGLSAIENEWFEVLRNADVALSKKKETIEILLDRARARDAYLRWVLASYISNQVDQPELHKDSIDVSFISSVIPETIHDALWSEVNGYKLVVTGQMELIPRWLQSSVRQVMVKAVHNEEEMALLFEWDDRTPDIRHVKSGGHDWEGKGADLPTRPFYLPGILNRPILFPYTDAIEVQWHFRESSTAKRPSVMWGDPDRPVLLWNWQADRWWPRGATGKPVGPQVQTIPTAGGGEPAIRRRYQRNSSTKDSGRQSSVRVSLSRGFSVELEPAQDGIPNAISSHAAWSDGKWKILLYGSKKELSVINEVASSFAPDKSLAKRENGDTDHMSVSVALHIWDGAAGEFGKRVGITKWFDLHFEESSQRTYRDTLVVVLVAAIMLVLLVSLYRLLKLRRSPV